MLRNLIPAASSCKRLHPFFAVTLILLFLASLHEASATIVTTINDEDDGATALTDTADISLREAINHSVSSTRITFDPSLSGQTIKLTLGQLVIDKDLIIDASFPTVHITIDANDQTRIIEVRENANVSIKHLKLINGRASGSLSVNRGGALYNIRATLSLDSCTLSNNSAFFGGAVHNNEGILNLTACTVSNNFARGFGGAIFNADGDLNFENCTFNANSADSNGGAISILDFSRRPSLSLRNCTLFGNSASRGGGINNFNNTTAESTIIVIENTILAGNNSPNARDISETGPGAAITAVGSNFLSSTEGSNIPTPSEGIIIVTAAELKLAPLGDYGGPTQTMPPLPTSPAIDAGETNATNGTDQRGLSRSADEARDIGAVEIQTIAEATTILASVWETDIDADGNLFGLEFTLGTNPHSPDSSHPRNPEIAADLSLLFGKNLNLPAGITVSIMRSTDLTDDSFLEVGTFDSGNETFTSLPNTFEEVGNSPHLFFRYQDDSPMPRSFFQIKTEYLPPAE